MADQGSPIEPRSMDEDPNSPQDEQGMMPQLLPPVRTRIHEGK